MKKLSHRQVQKKVSKFASGKNDQRNSIKRQGPMGKTV